MEMMVRVLGKGKDGKKIRGLITIPESIRMVNKIDTEIISVNKGIITIRGGG